MERFYGVKNQCSTRRGLDGCPALLLEAAFAPSLIEATFTRLVRKCGPRHETVGTAWGLCVVVVVDWDGC